MYDGPVYDLSDREVDNLNITTWAPSIAKAKSNFEFRYAKECNVPKGRYHLSSDEKYYQILDVKPSYMQLCCEKCGIPLSDGGYCTICDDREEDYF